MNDKKALQVFKFGAYTRREFGGKLVEVKLIVENEEIANEMMRDICNNSHCIDEDDGFFLNDKYYYK